jgi:hypothetical protein
MTYNILLEEPGQAESAITGKKSRQGYDYWYTPFFMEQIAKLHDVKPLLLQVFKGEELVATLPLYERKKLSLKALVCPVGAYYQGLHTFFEEEASPNRVLLDNCAISTEIALFLSSRYGRINLKLNPENPDVRGFTWNGFKAAPLYTFYHESNEALHILQDEKKKLRRAEAAGMSITEAFDPDSFLRLQKQLDQRKKKSLGVDLARLADFFAALHAKGLLKQYNIELDSRVVSTNILYYDGGDVAYTVFMASEEQAMKQGAATYHSVALLDHLPPQCRILDYCGANVPEVARFKAALGLKLKVFYSLSK